MSIIPYCLNIHAGEALADVRRAIDRYALEVKARLAPNTSYPLGLRLAAAAAAELHATPATLADFAACLADAGLHVTLINGFPFGTFHAQSVKQAVYHPDWATEERLTYTGQLAQILAQLLPPATGGNISSLPLGYAFNASGQRLAGDHLAQRHKVYARQLTIMAEFLAQQHDETGKEVVLALEPEPDCLLESVDDTIAWFEDELLYEGINWLSAHGRRTRTEAEMLLRTYLGICLDTCHFAVAFEEPLTVLRRLESACIRVARVQLSAAIGTIITPESLRALNAFVDPVYLHQTKIKLPRGRILALPDLTAETLALAAEHPHCELRTHFHVPLFWHGDEILASTNRELTPEFFAHIKRQRYALESETYTFDVLPPALRSGDVVTTLCQEHIWLQQQLEAADTGSQPPPEAGIPPAQ